MIKTIKKAASAVLAVVFAATLLPVRAGALYDYDPTIYAVGAGINWTPSTLVTNGESPTVTFSYTIDSKYQLKSGASFRIYYTKNGKEYSTNLGGIDFYPVSVQKPNIAGGNVTLKLDINSGTSYNEYYLTIDGVEPKPADLIETNIDLSVSFNETSSGVEITAIGTLSANGIPINGEIKLSRGDLSSTYSNGKTWEWDRKELNTAITATYEGSATYAPSATTRTISIKPQTAPSLTTRPTKSDTGKILGLDKDVTYEYKKGGETEWIPVDTGATEITGLKAGDYSVRVKAYRDGDTFYLASEEKNVEVKQADFTVSVIDPTEGIVWTSETSCDVVSKTVNGTYGTTDEQSIAHFYYDIDNGWYIPAENAFEVWIDGVIQDDYGTFEKIDEATQQGTGVQGHIYETGYNGWTLNYGLSFDGKTGGVSIAISQNQSPKDVTIIIKPRQTGVWNVTFDNTGETKPVKENESYTFNYTDDDYEYNDPPYMFIGDGEGKGTVEVDAENKTVTVSNVTGDFAFKLNLISKDAVRTKIDFELFDPEPETKSKIDQEVFCVGYKVKLTDANGYAIPNADITYYWWDYGRWNIIGYGKTDNDGVTNIGDTDGLDPGDHLLKAYYGGDVEYAPQQAVRTFTIVKQKPYEVPDDQIIAGNKDAKIVGLPANIEYLANGSGSWTSDSEWLEVKDIDYVAGFYGYYIDGIDVRWVTYRSGKYADFSNPNNPIFYIESGQQTAKILDENYKVTPVSGENIEWKSENPVNVAYDLGGPGEIPIISRVYFHVKANPGYKITRIYATDKKGKESGAYEELKFNETEWGYIKIEVVEATADLWLNVIAEEDADYVPTDPVEPPAPPEPPVITDPGETPEPPVTPETPAPSNPTTPTTPTFTSGISPSSVTVKILKESEFVLVKPLAKFKLPQNRLVITADKHGELDGYKIFTVTVERLKAANLSADKVKLYYIDENGKITDETKLIIRNSDGSVTIKFPRFSAYVLAETAPARYSSASALEALKISLKDIATKEEIENYDCDYDGRVTVKDALYILKASAAQ